MTRSALVVWLAFAAVGAADSVALRAQPPEEAPASAAESAAPQTPPADAAREALPKFQDLELPSAETLLTDAPRDWIILKNADVIICEPIVPRPETLQKRRAEIDAKSAERRGKTGDELARIQAEYEALQYLVFTLPEDSENPEYRIPLQLIDRILHHEDLVLQRIDRLVDEGTLEPAFELLFRLQRQWSDWPGVADRHNRLLFADGRRRLAAGEPEAALTVLVELQQRAPQTSGLPETVGEAMGSIVGQALAANDYRRARHFLFRLDALFPGHPVFQQYAAEMARGAGELLASAEQARSEGRHAEAALRAEEAAVFWPRTPNLMPRFRPIVQRYQRLRVGVVDLPTAQALAAPFPTPAVERARRLMQAPLFEVDRYRNGSAYYRTRYFESWEPHDLGRRLQITLRQSRQPWETQPLLDAPALADLLQRRLDPDDAEYDERLAGYIESVAVRSPVELELRFRRVPARVEPLLARLVPDTDWDSAIAAGFAGPDPFSPGPSGRLSEASSDRQGGFLPVELSPQRAVYRRAVPEPDGLAEYHVAEVVEVGYGSHEKALLGLRQGEVSMLVDLPDWIVRRVQSEPKLREELFVQPYALPLTHVLQINPESTPLRVRELRRALLCALDREQILRQVVLRDPSAAHGRVVTSPFPSFSPANSLDVDSRAFDSSAALALVLAASRQLDNQIPPLRMLVPNTPVERAAAEELVRAWRRIRIDVAIVDPGLLSDADDDWDLCYHTVRIAEPTVELWPFLVRAPTARIDDLAVFPDWLRHRLVEIDRTSDWGRALDTVRGLHAALWSEVRCIPLWEIDGFLVVRKHVQGFPERPMHCYHGIERWTLQAWYLNE